MGEGVDMPACMGEGVDRPAWERGWIGLHGRGGG